jgi:DNA-binding transcriptional LysR family regulator
MHDEFNDFPFQTDELRLLFLLSEELTVKKVAERLGRDHTTVTRQLNQLSKRYPVLQKNSGTWILTPFGHEIAKFCRKMMSEQRELVSLPRVIRIGTTKEFSEWVLAPLLAKILLLSKSSFQIVVLTEVGSFEAALMDGKIDIVLSCGRPVDPTIKFKKLLSFPLSCVYYNNLGTNRKIEALMNLPIVEHSGLTIRSLVPNREKYPRVVAQFDHISGVRGAARSGLGWTILPQYSVKADVENGKLFEIALPELRDLKEEFSLWYVRDYSNLEKVVKWITKAFE